eukprot:GHVR01135232.1.p1 GENE.GHVR01135232.1~~GHVR01135232.1.p1  ORF type:complete len:102 (-),score=15.89 GHVR01135232.1:117-422(-)
MPVNRLFNWLQKKKKKIGVLLIIGGVLVGGVVLLLVFYFFFRKKTKSSKKLRKKSQAASRAGQLIDSEWRQYFDVEGRAYYYNETTGRTQWEHPQAGEQSS